MTTPPEVELQVSQIPSGPTPQPWITISNIKPIPGTNAFTVTFDTDVTCLIQMDYWSHNDPSIPAGIAGVVTETATMRHTFTTPALPAGDHTGKYFGFSLRLDANDVSGYQMRSQQGMVRLIGARSVAKLNAVPVRWNTFGDGTRPANGGGTTNLGQGPAAGNWSSYTWAQYNPKGTTFPTP
jgi:hypothetical protein